MKKGPLGWLIGIITGTLVGVLFAPKKGEELRKNLKNERAKGGSGMGTLKTAYKGLGKDISETAKEAYDLPEVQKVVKKAQKNLKKIKKSAENVVVEGRKVLDETMEDVKKVVKKKGVEIKKQGEEIKKDVEKKVESVKKTAKKAVKKVNKKRK